MQIYGIGAVQREDKVGELIDIEGIDTSDLSVLNDEHGDRFSDILGSISFFQKIFSEKDVRTPKQKKCWDLVKSPFLYVEGKIVDDPNHIDASAAKSLLEFTQAHPELPLRVGLSIEGGIIQRAGENEKVLKRTKATGVSLTVKPCNPFCQVFIDENNLRKSLKDIAMPRKYLEAYMNGKITPSFVEIPLVMLQTQLETLHKSLLGEFASLRCYSCGHTDKFFKSSKNWPNHCDQCGTRFTMRELYKALQKKG